MSISGQDERRAAPRYEALVRVAVQPFSPFSSLDSSPKAQGESRNLNGRGLCVVLDEPCEVASLFRCEVFLTDVPVSIPTLGYVRWFHKNGDGKYVTGIEFLV